MLCDKELVNFYCKVLFKEIDIDNNGTIDCDEFKDFLKKLYKMIGHEPLEKNEAQIIFNQLDDNLDGELQFEEIKLFINKLLMESKGKLLQMEDESRFFIPLNFSNPLLEKSLKL
jgi:hypothetical protein